VRAQYSLGFISSDAKKDGTWRKLDVRLLGDKLQNLTIRTRKGYYAAYTVGPSAPGKPASQK
jgi:hypothetical protein